MKKTIQKSLPFSVTSATNSETNSSTAERYVKKPATFGVKTCSWVWKYFDQYKDKTMKECAR